MIVETADELLDDLKEVYENYYPAKYEYATTNLAKWIEYQLDLGYSIQIDMPSKSYITDKNGWRGMESVSYCRFITTEGKWGRCNLAKAEEISVRRPNGRAS